MSAPIVGAYHDPVLGRLVATCDCGWTSADALSPALVALRDHRELHHRPEGSAS